MDYVEGIISTRPNKEGTLFKVLQIGVRDFLLFPGGMAMFWGTDKAAEEGKICFSRLNHNNDYDYSEIGTWKVINEKIELRIFGIGIFDFISCRNGLVKIYEKIPSSPSETLRYRAVASQPFNPDNF
jgi:hypothetical protein